MEKKITYTEISKHIMFPEIDIPTNYEETILNFILEYQEKLGIEKILRIVLRETYLPEKDLRLFALFFAKQIKHLLKDEKSINALDVGQKYVDGKASIEEVKTAAFDAMKAANDYPSRVVAHAVLASFGDVINAMPASYLSFRAAYVSVVSNTIISARKFREDFEHFIFFQLRQILIHYEYTDKEYNWNTAKEYDWNRAKKKRESLDEIVIRNSLSDVEIFATLIIALFILGFLISTVIEVNKKEIQHFNLKKCWKSAKN